MKYDIVFSTSNNVNLNVALRLLHAYGIRLGSGSSFYEANGNPASVTTAVTSHTDVTIGIGLASKLASILAYAPVKSPEELPRLVGSGAEAGQFFLLDGGEGLHLFGRALAREMEGAAGKTWNIRNSDGTTQAIAVVDKGRRAIKVGDEYVSVEQLKALEAALLPPRAPEIRVQGYKPTLSPARQEVVFGCVAISVALIKEMIAAIEK